MNYFEINKIYREDEINLKTYIEKNINKFTRTNITNYKNISYKNSYIVEEKLNQYIDYIRSKQIKYKSSQKKNLEAIEYIIQIPLAFTTQENKNQLNKFIDDIKENYLIKNTWYFSFIRKTKGKSAYIHLLTLDRIVFEDGKEVEVKKEYKSNIYYDITSGRRCKEDNLNAKLLYKKGDVVSSKKVIYISDKIRLDYINTNPKEEITNKMFNNFTKFIREEVIDLLLKKYMDKVIPKFLKELKKKTIKKVIKKNGKKLYVNKYTYLYDKEEEILKRRVRAYNSTINQINAFLSYDNSKDGHYIKRIIEELERIDNIINIKVFEREISFFNEIFKFL